MQLPIMSDNAADDVVNPVAAEKPAAEANKFDGTPRPITEVVVQPDFPKSALGEFVEIGGLTGIVIEIVNQSLKVKSKDGVVQSFNGNVLKKLYAPVLRPTPVAEPVRATESSYGAGRSVDRDEEDDNDNQDEVAEVEVVVSEAKYQTVARPIAEFITLADYPKCLLGEHIDIGGFTGVVVELADKSLKVKPRHGVSQRFNANVLKRVYGPQPKREERPTRPTYKEPTVAAKAVEAAPRNVLAEPDFNTAVKQITEFTGRADYPQCMFGVHVEINGFTGVVIEIVKGSLKVKSHDGLTRSYNAQVVRKVHG